MAPLIILKLQDDLDIDDDDFRATFIVDSEVHIGVYTVEKMFAKVTE